jgi:hypothetical protein
VLVFPDCSTLVGIGVLTAILVVLGGSICVVFGCIFSTTCGLACVTGLSSGVGATGAGFCSVTTCLTGGGGAARGGGGGAAGAGGGGAAGAAGAAATVDGESITFSGFNFTSCFGSGSCGFGTSGGLIVSSVGGGSIISNAIGSSISGVLFKRLFRPKVHTPILKISEPIRL